MYFVYLISLATLLLVNSENLVNDISHKIINNHNDIIEVDDPTLLTYETAVALYGIDTANNLKNTNKLVIPDDPDKAYSITATQSRIKLWSQQGDVIPYVVESNNLNDILRQTLSELSQVTNLKFTVRTNQRNYLKFVNSGYCGGLSFIGMIGGGQSIRVPTVKNCFNSKNVATGITKHEIMHAVGFSHQHSYPNRDNHVKILSENIQSGTESNFKKRLENIIDTFGFPYDYKSIMHYKSRTFSKNGGNTITKLDGTVPLGNFGGNSLTQIDIDKINKLYPNKSVQPPTKQPIERPTVKPTNLLLPTTMPSTMPSTRNQCRVVREKCVFPFTFRGITYMSCTDVTDAPGNLWCSTKVDANGKHIAGNWGYCSSSCR